MTFDLPAITIDGVADFFWSRMLKMHGLSREWSNAGCDKEKPRQQLRPVRRRADQSSGLLSEIKQDRIGIENACFLAARPFGIDNGRHLPVRIDRTKFGRMLRALAGVDWN